MTSKKLNCELIRSPDFDPLIKLAVDGYSLVNHHLASYNKLIRIGLTQILREVFVTEIQVAADPKINPDIKTLKCQINYSNVNVSNPITPHQNKEPTILTPNEARINNLNYVGATTVDVEIITTAYYKDEHVETRKDILTNFEIMKLPIMVNSVKCVLYGTNWQTRLAYNEDPLDPGGQFILHGKEWAIDSIESAPFNSPMITYNIGHNQEVTRLQILTKPGDSFENSSDIIIRLLKNGAITLEFSSSTSRPIILKNRPIPITILFRLFGMCDDQQIMENIAYSGGGAKAEGVSTSTNSVDISRQMLQHLRIAFNTPDSADRFGALAQEYDPVKLYNGFTHRIAEMNFVSDPKIANDFKSVDKLQQHFQTQFHPMFCKFMFPNVGRTTDKYLDKLRYLGHLIHRMLLVNMGIAPSVDRENLKNKRVVPAGQSLSKDLKMTINTCLVQTSQRQITKVLQNTKFTTKPEEFSIRQAYIRGISNEKFTNTTIHNIASSKRDIASAEKRSRITSEQIPRKNEIFSINVARLIRAKGTMAKASLRSLQMRSVHPSYTYAICPTQSADTGDQVGLVKQLAIASRLSAAGDSHSLMQMLLADPDIFPLVRVLPKDVKNLTNIMVNGTWIGCCAIPAQIVRRYRELRRGYVSSAIDPEHPTKIEGKSALDILLAEQFTSIIGGAAKPSKSTKSDAKSATKQAKAAKSTKSDAKSATKLDDKSDSDSDNSDDKPATIMAEQTKPRIDHQLENVSIQWDTANKQIDFWIDAGRIIYPLLVVRNNAEMDPVGQQLLADHGKYDAKEDKNFVQDVLIRKSDFTRTASDKANATGDVRHHYDTNKPSMANLVRRGVVEYISPNEIEGLLVAPSVEALVHQAHNSLLRYTHCGIPVTMMGIVALTCPYMTHNESPRVVYQTNQAKQTCGYPSLSYAHRMDKALYVQWACQKPLISTIAYDYTGPNGSNVIVAIFDPKGQNQEDSIIGCATSSQRGLFATQYYATETIELQDNYLVGKPSEDIRNSNKNYDHLVGGEPPVGTVLRRGDALIGLIENTNETINGRSQFCRSVFYDGEEIIRIERINRGCNFEKKNFISIKYSSARPFGVGHKFSSRHGQKAMTGEMLAQEDMPYTRLGLTPDIILSPHAIPSRMTIGQLFEAGGSKCAALKGVIERVSAFTEVEVEQICQELERLGAHPAGTDACYDGLTGEFINVRIMICPTFYQRLQKFVEEELYSVVACNVDPITLQPAEGRQRDGGLRFGEMEKDCAIGNGTGTFTTEMTRDNSDPVTIYVCATCGSRPIVNTMDQTIQCKMCEYQRTTPNVHRIKSSRASHVWLHELEASGLRPILTVDNNL